MMRLPYLIQRVMHRREPCTSHKGIDAIFSFDYMGSAEFEFGTIPRAYRIMREARTDDWKVRELKIGVAPTSTNLTAYFVGRPADLPVAEALLRDQLQKTPKHRTKEITSIRVSYGLDEPFGYGVYDGWWAVDTGLRQAPDDTCAPFVIFRMREHAQAWLKAMEATTAASKQ